MSVCGINEDSASLRNWRRSGAALQQCHHHRCIIIIIIAIIIIAIIIAIIIIITTVTIIIIVIIFYDLSLAPFLISCSAQLSTHFPKRGSSDSD